MLGLRPAFQLGHHAGQVDRTLGGLGQVLGVVGCLVLVATLPGASIAVGAGVLLVGVVGRAVVLARRRRAAATR